MTLTEFLLARIAEDEAVAMAAVIPAHDGYKPHPALQGWQYEPWSPSRSGEVEYVQTSEMLAHKYAEPYYVTCDGEGLSPSVNEDVGPHIARHDPARVLAECEAKRRIVDDHKMMPPRLNVAWRDGCCERCTAWGEYGEPLEDGSLNYCPTLRALAAVYADHPDYRDKWRP